MMSRCGWSLLAILLLEQSQAAVVATIGSDVVQDTELIDDKSVFEFNKQAIQVYQARRQRLHDVLLKKLAVKEAGKEDPTAFLEKKLKDASKKPSKKEIDTFLSKNVPPDKIPVEEDKREHLRSKISEYLEESKKDEAKAALLEKWTKKHKVKISLAPELQSLPSGKLNIPEAPQTGNANAKVVIVAFSDFQCPFCAKVLDTLDELKKSYPKDSVSIQFRHFPLNFHPRAEPAARASFCAHQQGKFWQMHDRLFQNQLNLEDEDLQKHGKAIGLKMETFQSCMTSELARTSVQKDFESGAAAGVSSTPTFVVNGQPVAGALPVELFKVLIDAELAKN